MAGSERRRLDVALVERRMVETRAKARAMILAGDVLVNGTTALHAGTAIGDRDEILLRAKPRFVSRGGEKLAHALTEFEIDVRGRICADLGASTGGFTDCLLQNGASKVYAVDVGYGQLNERLRVDSRVVVLDRTNARYLKSLPELVSLVVIDVSFISVTLILPVARQLVDAHGWCVPLIKPQFEAGKGQVGKGGVVRSPEVHQRVLQNVLAAASTNGFGIRGLTRSPILGPAGNVEFLTALRAEANPDQEAQSREIAHMIDDVAGVSESDAANGPRR